MSEDELKRCGKSLSIGRVWRLIGASAGMVAIAVACILLLRWTLGA